MKAAVLEKLKSPLVIRDIDCPIIRADEVLIRVAACGICRTDLHIQDGSAYVPELPHILGHEPAGTVVEVGGDVSGWSIGDRVVPHLFITTGSELGLQPRCAPCHNVSGIIGVTRPGGFAEYLSIPAKNLLRVPDNVSLGVAGLVSCAGVTAVHAFHRSRLASHETVAIIGSGGIGLILCQIAKSHGCRVIACDLSRENLEIAVKQGNVDQAVLPNELVAAVKALNPSGAHVVFDLVGVQASISLAVDSIADRGRILVIGEEDEELPVNTITLAQRELELIGSRNGGVDDAKDSLDLMSRGVICPHIDSHFPLDRINRAIDRIRDGHARGRIVVTF